MKKVISLIIALAIVMLFAGACSNKRLPDLEAASRYSDDELIDLAKKVDEKALIKRWGEPIVVHNERLWPVELDGGTKYMVAYVENGGVISLNFSKTMFITVVEGENGVKYCLFGWNDYSTDAVNLAFMPSQDCFGNEISCEAGDLLLFETDGMVAETYPAHLANPYSVRTMGHLSDEELHALVDKIEFPYIS